MLFNTTPPPPSARPRLRAARPTRTWLFARGHPCIPTQGRTALFERAPGCALRIFAAAGQHHRWSARALRLPLAGRDAMAPFGSRWLAGREAGWRPDGLSRGVRPEQGGPLPPRAPPPDTAAALVYQDRRAGQEMGGRVAHVSSIGYRDRISDIEIRYYRVRASEILYCPDTVKI